MPTRSAMATPTRVHVSARIRIETMERLDGIWSDIGRSAKTARLMDAILETMAPRSIDTVVKMLKATAPDQPPHSFVQHRGANGVTHAMLRRLARSTNRQRPPKERISARISELADYRLREISRRARVSQTIETILDLVVALHEGRPLEDVLSDITAPLRSMSGHTARQHAEHEHQPDDRL